MLVRLVGKGVLTRRRVIGPTGRGQYIYLRRARESELECDALKRLSDDFFSGSLRAAARFLNKMMEGYGAPAVEQFQKFAAIIALAAC